VVTWEIQDSVLFLTTAGFGGQETLFALSQAVSDPAFRTGLTLLCDLRLQTDDLGWEEMGARAKFIASLLPLGISRRCALVIGVHQFSIARIEAAHLEYEGMEPGVFRDMDEAREWLVSPTSSTRAEESPEEQMARLRGTGSETLRRAPQAEEARPKPALRPTGTTSRS